MPQRMTPTDKAMLSESVIESAKAAGKKQRRS
jgi:hypothetical protein